MRWYHGLSTKVALTVMLSVGAVIIALIMLATSYVGSQLWWEAEAQRQAKVDLIRQELDSVDSLMQEQLKASIRVLKHEAGELGAPSLGGPVRVADKTVPDLKLGGSPQANTFVLVDRVKDLMGGVATLFVRSGDDFVRISTNVQTSSGARGIGTVLDPQGKAIAALRQGKTFYGTVYILDKPFITLYEPITDAGGEVIGAWFVGYQVSTFLERIDKAIGKADQLASLFLVLVDDKKKLPYEPSVEVSQDVLQKITQSDTNKDFDGWNVLHTTYEPWNYKIVSAYSNNDPALTGRIFSMRLWFTLGNLALIIILGALITFLTRWFMRPLDDAVRVARDLALGKTVQAADIKINSRDEVGTMLSAMRDVNDYIRGVDVGVEALGRGDLSHEAVPRSAEDLLSKNLNQTTLSLKGLINETDHLIREVEAGRLSTRGNVAVFNGAYADLVNGVNRMMDSVLVPVSEISGALQSVSEKDLSVRIVSEYKGDFEKIKMAFNTAVSILDESLEQVNSGAEQVASAANQISAGSSSLAQGASEQASTLEEVSASIQEISAMGKQNASNAKEARSLSDNAHKTAEAGVTSMNRLSDAIEKIKKSSDDTAKIVKTIEEIAFQTNLLALNAAVEAARAGDAGKGFAVVAEEVRNLAMRSAEAAQQTATLIEESVNNTESGVSLNREVLEKLSEINSQTEKVSVVIAEIAAASEQQTSGVDQITIAVEQMNGVTQQAAANSEESAAAAEELSSQSQEMLSLIGQFRLSKTSSGNSAAGRKLRGATVASAASAVVKRGNGNNFRKAGYGNPPRLGAGEVIPFDELDDDVLREF